MASLPHRGGTRQAAAEPAVMLAMLPVPPTTTAQPPLARFCSPPPTMAVPPLAVFCDPPPTLANAPLAVLLLSLLHI